MRIRTLHVNGFGIHHNLTLQLPDTDAPVVLLGPNEAGKSTLAGFVRAVLFGFAPRSQPERRREPVRGGHHGGFLLLADDAGRITRIERTGGSEGGRTGASAGVLKVTTPDGTTGGEALLASVTGGIGAELYRHLFAFGLEELEDLRSLNSGELGPYLFSAGMGIDGARVLRSEQRIRQEMEQLYRPRGSRQEIPGLLEEIERADRTLRQAKERSGDFDRVQEQWRIAGERIAELDEALLACREQTDWLHTCRGARSDWLRAIELRAEAERLPVVESFPEDGLTRLESALAERGRLDRRREEMLAELERLTREIERLPVDDELLGRREAIASLREKLPGYREWTIRSAELGQELAAAEAELRRQIVLIDPGWEEEALARFPLDVGTRERLRMFREEREELRRLELSAAGGDDRLDKQREAMQAELRRLEAAMTEAGQAAARACPGLSGCSAGKAREVRDELTREFAAWDKLEEHRRGNRERLDELRKQAEDWRQWQRRTRSAAPSGLSALWWPAAAIVGLGAAWAAWHWTPLGWIGAAGVLALAGASGIYGGWRFLAARGQERKNPMGRIMQRLHEEIAEREARESEHEHACREQRDRLAAGIRAVWASPYSAAASELQAVDSGDARHPPASSAGDRRDRRLDDGFSEACRAVDRYAAEMDKTERLAERCDALRSQVQAIRRQSDEQARERESLGERLLEWKQRWEEWLSQHRLSAELTPEGGEDIVRLAEQAVRLRQQRDRLAEQRTAYTERMRTIRAEAAAVLGAEPEDVESAIAELAGALKRELAKEQERSAKGQAAERLRREIEDLGIPAGQTQDMIDRLYREAGCENEESFRRLAAAHARRNELDGELARIESMLAVWAGARGLSALEVQLAAASQERLDRSWNEERERMQSLEQELNEWKDRRGRCARELEELRASTQIADLQQAREQLRTRLVQRSERWAALALCSQLLRETRRVYETERQPAVLRRASEYFRLMTDGAYIRIAARIGEQTVSAVRPDGEQVDAASLSRGTAEQMFIAIRLALAGEYARTAALPILADDIFVNFDEVRLRSAMRVLREVCRTQQFVMCTCHPHVAEAVTAEFPEAHVHQLDYS